MPSLFCASFRAGAEIHVELVTKLTYQSQIPRSPIYLNRTILSVPPATLSHLSIPPQLIPYRAVCVRRKLKLGLRYSRIGDGSTKAGGEQGYWSRSTFQLPIHWNAEQQIFVRQLTLCTSYTRLFLVVASILS